MMFISRMARQLMARHTRSRVLTSLLSSARMALLLGGMCTGLAAQTQVNGAPQVVSGQATFAQKGNVFSITNTPNAVINWQSFSVAKGAVTEFIQQSTSSAVLNRIVGQDPSQILGSLQSNGQVYLINPNGIVFGANAQVDVNGLVASSHRLSTEDFLAGRRIFSSEQGAGSVSNLGRITTAAGGQVLLIADSVNNSGVITAPGGDVILAAGHTVQIASTSNPSLQVVVSAPSNAAVNLGKIVANAGSVGIFGALIEQRGTISADTAVKGENGSILLRASAGVTHYAGSKTTANGFGAGTINVVSGGDISVLVDAAVTASKAVKFEAAGAVTLANDSVVSANAEISMNGGRTKAKPRASELPSAGTCLESPNFAGCDQVLTVQVCAGASSPAAIARCAALHPPAPSLDTCIASPSTAGCDAVLPSLSQCTSADHGGLLRRAAHCFGLYDCAHYGGLFGSVA